ncbi:hypothetical protein LWI28_003056 [Acer negundo]|uniref:Uncharacterized protein n=1 Tax=Acer negundo TaxID=4023 RepID=A0AAD5NIE9_ACENE|nr:hypothetical protein LWI28_003056 [Acer negundo]
MLSVDASGVGSPQDSWWLSCPISSRRSQFENLEEGTSGQLPTGHRNGTNTVVSGHIQRVTPENSAVEVQERSRSSSSSSSESITRPIYENIINAGKALLPGKKILSKTPWLKRLELAIWPTYGLEEGPNFYSADLLLVQYFLTVIILYIMFTRATRTCATLARATWAKAAFNLLLYIHGGHVFGGLWYAFAMAKEIDCWKKACKYYASEFWYSRDVEFSKEGFTLFPMGTAKSQVYLQLQTNKSEMIRQKKQEIEQSKSFEKLPKNLQKQIKKYQPEKWEETKGGVEFENLFNNLPDDLRRNIRRELCLELLKKARMSDGLDLGDLYPVCLCGRRAHIYTSWTDSNPGRRF